MQVVLLGAALACISPISSLPQGSVTDTRIVNRPPAGLNNPLTSTGQSNPQGNLPGPHGAIGSHDLPHGSSPIPHHNNFQGAGPVHRPISTDVPGPPIDSVSSTPSPQGQDALRPGTLLMPNGQIGANARPPQSSEGKRHRSCGIFPNPGECQAAFPRYYYNKTTSQCDCYLFGGCDEGIGSYRTLEECHRKCLPDVKKEGPSCDLVYIDNFQPFPPSTTEPTTRIPNRGNSVPPPPIFPSNERPERPSNNLPAHHQHPSNPHSNVRPTNNDQIHHQQPSNSPEATNIPGRPSNTRPMRGRRPIPNPPLFPTEVTQKTIPQNPVRPTRRPVVNRQPAQRPSVFPSNDPGRATTLRPMQPVTNQPAAVETQSIPGAPVFPTGNTQIKPNNTPEGFTGEDAGIPAPPLFPTEVRQNQPATRPESNTNPQSNNPLTSKLPAGSGSRNPAVISTITEVDFPDSKRNQPIPVGIPIPEGTPSGGVFPNVAFPDYDGSEPKMYVQDIFPGEEEYSDENSGLFIA